MKKSRRVPRKFGGDDEGDVVSNSTPASTPDTSPLPSAVKRPTLGSRTSTKPKTSSSLRTSLAFDDLDTTTPDLPLKKPTSNLAKRALDRASNLPLRAGQPDDRPSYSSDYLNELKNSTPTTPVNLSITEDNDIPPPATLDIASKFGTDTLITAVSDSSTTHIPSAAEIFEKKERRRRLAKEHDYIPLADNDTDPPPEDTPLSDDEFAPRQTLIHSASDPKASKYDTDTRLIRDDEDIFEDFEQFTEDSGKVALSRRGAREQNAQRRKELADQIKAAQHGYGYKAGDSANSESDSDDNDEIDHEEAARNAAYEAAQTRAGTYSTGSSLQRERAREESARRRFDVQPKVRQIPELKAVVGRFWELVRAEEAEVEASKRRLEKVARERVEMGEEEVRIKALLREAGERYERLRRESVVPTTMPAGERDQMEGEGMVGGVDGVAEVVPSKAAVTPVTEVQEQGTEEQVKDEVVDDDEEEEEEEEEVEAPAGMGLGFSMGPRSGFGGMSAARAAEDDW